MILCGTRNKRSSRCHWNITGPQKGDPKATAKGSKPLPCWTITLEMSNCSCQLGYIFKSASFRPLSSFCATRRLKTNEKMPTPSTSKKHTARGSLKCHLSHPHGPRQTGISIIPGRWPVGSFFSQAFWIPSSVSTLTLYSCGKLMWWPASSLFSNS